MILKGFLWVCLMILLSCNTNAQETLLKTKGKGTYILISGNIALMEGFIFDLSLPDYLIYDTMHYSGIEKAFIGSSYKLILNESYSCIQLESGVSSVFRKATIKEKARWSYRHNVHLYNEHSQKVGSMIMALCDQNEIRKDIQKQWDELFISTDKMEREEYSLKMNLFIKKYNYLLE